ncbi:MAG: ferredoxin--nitrite reductase [Selenomonadaceae bacterium]|nr:ferredoxin--nitrite reductase [Selenomonadaceae bacterium]
MREIIKSWRNRPDLNKNEQYKLAKDGLQILDDLPRFASLTQQEMLASDVELLKWAGIYAQRPRDGHYLVRAKLPSGALTAAQAKVLADISRDYGRHTIQITDRHSLQIHWLELRVLADVVQRLHAAGLTSTEACGDCPRNILGNPLMGVDPEETVDTEPIVAALIEKFQGNPAFSNLPRKFKISVSANPHDTGFARINDIAFVPAEYEGQAGFHVYVGGGLSKEPKLAQQLPFFVRPTEVVRVAEAVATIFREHGYRANRAHCRLKYLVEDWGVAKFSEAVEQLAGPLARGGRSLTRDWNPGIYYGLHPQKQAGLCYAGLHIPAGEMDADDLTALAELAERYGSGRLRTTNTQNILLLDIPADKGAALAQEPLCQKFSLQPHWFSGFETSCTGNAFCNFAPLETKERLIRLTQALDATFPQVNQPVRINLTGCLHSCAQPQIADIGLTGRIIKLPNGETSAAFTVQLGGQLGPDAHFATPLTGVIPEKELLPFCRALIERWLVDRQDTEGISTWLQAQDRAKLQALLQPYIL